MQLGYIARGVALPPPISPSPTLRSIARVALVLAISRECRGKETVSRCIVQTSQLIRSTLQFEISFGATRVVSSYFSSRLLVEYLNFETAQKDVYFIILSLYGIIKKQGRRIKKVGKCKK